jgi:hypothetical protein
MNDEELYNWVRSLIERKAPESSSLDYKAEIHLDSKIKHNRVELGKDVSSFANEGGGILLYGVPEEDEQESGVPIPKDISECGIEIAEDLPEKIENILLDIIEPPLPELYIKVLKLEELGSKSLLMIYHPESWGKPHMVEGYKDARYYRRGNFRAVVMTERQVEAAYFSRKVSLTHAEDFFETGDFRTITKEGRFLRVVICPRFTLIRKEEMREEQFIEWLRENAPKDFNKSWTPFLNGWSVLSYRDGKISGNSSELRLFHNGSICFNVDLDRYAIKKNENKCFLLLEVMEKLFNNMILSYANKAFEFLKISGPLSAQINLYSVDGLNAIFPHGSSFGGVSEGSTPIDKNDISFIEELSVDELRFHFDNVLKRLMNRLATVFGIWRK